MAKEVENAVEFSEAKMVKLLAALLGRSRHVSDVRTFHDAGVLTLNRGLVVKTADGHKYQITVVDCS
jgi:hypothetical protein